MVLHSYTDAADISDRQPICGAVVLWSFVVILGIMSLLCIAALGLWKLVAFVRTHWWVPRRIRDVMRRQGIKGPAPQFMHGNLLQRRRMREESLRHDMHGVTHDIVPRLMPDYVHWSSIYGKRFLFWWGAEPRLTISEPELIREVLSSKHVHSLGRSTLQKQGVKDFIGEGLLMANGEAWAHQRRVVAPAFHVEKLKGQIGHMVECTGQLLDKWEGLIIANKSRMEEAGAEVEVEAEMSRLAGDVIARTEFGSSYEQGKLIFSKLNQLQKLSTQSPCSREDRKRVSELRKQVERLLQELIRARRDSATSGRASSYGQDLLGLILSEIELEAARKESQLTGDDRASFYEAAQVEAGRPFKCMPERTFQYTEAHLMDECKTFFFTGHDTTSLLLTWTLMLLASNPTWQDRARQEVLHVCHGRIPDADVIGKLKVLGMILLESLRLYTPATLLARQAFTDIKIGDIFIPKGMSVWVPVLAIHHDKAIWGMDADQFNPHRFSEGVAKAPVMSLKQQHNQHHEQVKQEQLPRQQLQHQQQEQRPEKQEQEQHPIMHHGFLPFSFGPRNCVGQNFALYEAKVVLAMILARFKFHLSPNYRHAPIFVLTLKPKHGVPIIIKTLDTFSKPHV